MIKKYLKKLIEECLLEKKITCVKIVADSKNLQVHMSDCTLIGGGSSIEIKKLEENEPMPN